MRSEMNNLVPERYGGQTKILNGTTPSKPTYTDDLEQSVRG
jgi:hypothetical protein